MKKILTIILDGFGMRDEVYGNAIKDADMTCFNQLWEEYPHSLLKASETAIGLREGQIGNSEVGHKTIGAGRLIKQNEILVDEFLKSNVEENEIFQKLLLKKDKDIHLMGLCSDGNVHAGIDDMLKMYEILVKNDFKKLHFHLITDGRDTDIHSSYKYISQIEDAIKKQRVGNIATICGRYYAMDRDYNYDRTKLYYDLVTKGVGISSLDINKTIQKMYEKNITDEFLNPIILDNGSLIKDGDVLVWLNYRADRSRQILASFVDSLFDGFNAYKMDELEVYSFFPIDKSIPTLHFIERQSISNALGIYLSDLGLTQARIAETEKFPHVTYFFDGEYAGKIPKCNTFNIPSPDVSTYDLKPEMSAIAVTKKCIECMVQDYDFILVNFANPDMVGHTGEYDAAVKACMAVDLCLAKLIEKADENFYKVIILADHGNVEIMLDENDNKITTHTLSKVPFIIVDKNISLKEEGDLTMVAPTILEYMDIAVPEEMKETDNLFE
ncbi:MAG: 2,3-bisphosphoglycerate-independent phosphoglycerate mutase [Firmicutes bacterium]|nr:2,3-bisphosphoglycerate-independent phosphoglycerate mutase [Bacillota bacterium]